MRVLISGTGSIGRRHIKTLQSIGRQVDFALIRDGGREDALSQDLGAAVFADLATALAWEPDIALVATPSDRHHELLMPLLRAGVATFVEKPVVVRDHHVRSLDSAMSTGVLPPTQAGCVLRFLPAVRTLRSWISAGRFGAVVRATFEAGQYLPDWRPTQDYRTGYSASSSRGGGVIFDLIHELDLAVHMFGDLSLLHAAAAVGASHLEIGSEEAALIALRAPAGALVSVALDYVSRTPVRRIEIVGDLGTARLDFIAKRLEWIPPDGTIEACTDGFDVAEAYRAELAELIEAWESGGATSLPLAEGLRATRLAIAARKMAGIGDEEA